jgi:hypothetical protein
MPEMAIDANSTGYWKAGKHRTAYSVAESRRLPGAARQWPDSSAELLSLNDDRRIFSCVMSVARA